MSILTCGLDVEGKLCDYTVVQLQYYKSVIVLDLNSLMVYGWQLEHDTSHKKYMY